MTICVYIAKFVFGMVENRMGKGEIASYQHFSFSYNVFEKLSLCLVKSQDCLLKGLSDTESTQDLMTLKVFHESAKNIDAGLLCAG